MKAVHLDESLAEAHNSLAHAKFHQFKWEEAGQEFKRAVELNPSSSIAHFYYANYLLVVGQLAEAISEAQRAQELDPVVPMVITNVVLIFCRAGQ